MQTERIHFDVRAICILLHINSARFPKAAWACGKWHGSWINIRSGNNNVIYVFQKNVRMCVATWCWSTQAKLLHFSLFDFRRVHLSLQMEFGRSAFARKMFATIYLLQLSHINRALTFMTQIFQQRRQTKATATLCSRKY